MGLLATLAEGAATSSAEAVLFWVFAAIALGSAVAVVALRNVVHAALMLVVNLLSVAALYLGLQSSFLSIVQVIVYAGAIVVLFLFVIMLLGVDRDDLLGTRTPARAAAAITAGVALAGAFLVVVGADSLTAASACGELAGDGAAGAVSCVGLDGVADDSVSFVGLQLFTRWTFAFEAAALLLVVATLGALVLGRRRDPHLEDDLVPSAPVPDAEDLADTRALIGGDDEPADDATPEDTAEPDTAATTEVHTGGHTFESAGGRAVPDVDDAGDTGKDA